MTLRRGAVLPVLAAFLLGCGDKDSVTCPPTPDPDAFTTMNALVVEEALVAFAADNEGRFPDDISQDESTSGATLVDFLPEGRLLENPYSGERTEPRIGPATAPGQVVYAVKQGVYVNYGYTVTARGAEGELITLDNIADLEAMVMDNARTVRDAAIQFYVANGGRFPSIVPDFREYLPDGALIVNPFTLRATEPRDSPGTARGAIYYSPVQIEYPGIGPVNAGFNIEGWGEDVHVGWPLIQLGAVY